MDYWGKKMLRNELLRHLAFSNHIYVVSALLFNCRKRKHTKRIYRLLITKI